MNGIRIGKKDKAWKLNNFDFHNDTMSMIHEYIMYIKFTFNKAMQCFPHAMPHQSSILATARNISKHEYKMYHYKRIPTMDGVQAPFLSVNSSAQNIHHIEI